MLLPSYSAACWHSSVDVMLVMDVHFNLRIVIHVREIWIMKIEIFSLLLSSRTLTFPDPLQIKTLNMADNDKFCLSWNSFEENIRTSYKELKQERDFCDVTVACEEDFALEAHKVVLSSCSSFFKNLLRRHQTHRHPLLFLRGVKQADLESLINFMLVLPWI